MKELEKKEKSLREIVINYDAFHEEGAYYYVSDHYYKSDNGYGSYSVGGKTPDTGNEILF